MRIMVTDSLVGRTVDRRYRVDARLAAGGMATVYRATDLRLDRRVALKVMRPEYARDPQFVARFQREARAAAQLSHPNVVGVFDQGQSDGLVYLAMEFVAGRTLREVISNQGQLSASQALAVLDPVLAGLAAAHAAGFVHRDVKPENVLIPDSGTIKVTDFGLARTLEQPSNATTGVLIGTAAYLAPEHVSEGHSDERSDVYQAGILLYEMLSGDLPHTGDTAWSVAYSAVENDVPPLQDVLPGISPGLAELVQSATRRDPAQRIESVTEFLDRSRAIASLLPPPAPFKVFSDTAVIADPTIANTERQDTERQDADDAVMKPQATALLSDSNPPRTSPHPADTRALSAHDDGNVQPPPKGKSKYPGKRRSRRTVILLTMLAVGLTAFAAWTLALDPFNRTDVPQVRDLTPDAAASRIVEANLRVGQKKPAFDDKIKSGRVIKASPESGTEVKGDTTIDLIVSKGPAPVVLPDLAGEPSSASQTRLQDLGLKSSVKGSEYSDSIGEGRVIRTSPTAGTTVHRGDTVGLVISKGPDLVNVPDVVDLPRADAIAAVESAGLEAVISEGFITPLDRVFSQDPEGGTSVPKGSQVTLSIF